MTADQAASPPAEQLLGLAARRQDGVLADPGRRHEIHLRAGRITHVLVGGVRPGPGPGPDRAAGTAAAALATREAFVDGVRELLDADPGAAARWAPKRRSPLDTAGVRLNVPGVLAEVGRRRAVLERLAGLVTADAPLARRPELPVAAVRITPRQWALLALAEEGVTPRELAGPLGDSVFRTVCRCHELLRLGLLDAPSATAPAPGAALFLASSD